MVYSCVVSYQEHSAMNAHSSQAGHSPVLAIKGQLSRAVRGRGSKDRQLQLRHTWSYAISARCATETPVSTHFSRRTGDQRKRSGVLKMAGCPATCGEDGFGCGLNDQPASHYKSASNPALECGRACCTTSRPEPRKAAVDIPVSLPGFAGVRTESAGAGSRPPNSFGSAPDRRPNRRRRGV